MTFYCFDFFTLQFKFIYLFLICFVELKAELFFRQKKKKIVLSEKYNPNHYRYVDAKLFIRN